MKQTAMAPMSIKENFQQLSNIKILFVSDGMVRLYSLFVTQETQIMPSIERLAFENERTYFKIPENISAFSERPMRTVVNSGEQFNYFGIVLE